jgi:hypothetical protein
MLFAKEIFSKLMKANSYRKDTEVACPDPFNPMNLNFRLTAGEYMIYFLPIVANDLTCTTANTMA